MNYTQYLRLKSLLVDEAFNHKINRTFAHGLEQHLNNKQLLKVWMATKIDKHRYYISPILLQISVFLMGFFLGLGLLSYTGSEPVNVVYFFLFSVVLPFFTLLGSLFFLLIKIDIDPIRDFFKRHLHLSNIETLSIPYAVEKWFLFARGQLLSLFYVLGILLALVFVVTTRDIAFGWSITLDIDSHRVFAFTSFLAKAWEFIYIDASPSYELIEISRYFRLGGVLPQEFINHALSLGQWWKFLAFSVLTYAIVPRLIVYIVAFVTSRYVISVALRDDKQIQLLLSQFNEPIIERDSTKIIMSQTSLQMSNSSIVTTLPSDFQVYFYGIDGLMQESIRKIFHIDARECTDKYKGKCVVFLKAWEPPTMEIIDFLSTRDKTQTTLFLVGTPKYGFKVKEHDIEIWIDKLQMENMMIKVYYE